MNTIYRLVWNDINATWMPVPERARARGKRAGAAVLTAALLLAVPLAHAQSGPAPGALPEGGRVVAGQASIAGAGATLTVTQSTDRAAIDWNRFDVGSAARVDFVQPSSRSVTLNRVQGSDPSQILGRITANGQVFLSNPNGVYFAPGASVDVAGLVATTHRINVDDFMAGRHRFERNGATGSVINAGELKAALGGYIALLAPEVRNQGVIVARLGTAALAAGEAFDLQFEGNHSLAGLRVTPATVRAIVDNRSAVLAPGGLIILSAQAADRVQGGVIRNTGQIEATGLAQRNGRIVLEAAEVTQTATGVIDVGGVGPAGSVDVAATGAVHLAGQVNASARPSPSPTATANADTGATATAIAVAVGGRISVRAATITLDSARIDASGARGGRVDIEARRPAAAPATPARVALNGRSEVAARGSKAEGGSVTVLGEHLDLNDQTRIDASGASGGGRVLVGGDWQGAGALPQATTVTMAVQALIDASATAAGDGGTVVLWSAIDRRDSVTRVAGSILAAGAGGGRGGQVETSGHALAVAGSARVETGPAGEWLLDPADITIAASDANQTLSGGSFTPNSGVNSATINVATLVTALNSGNVTITTQNSGTAGGGNGDIFVNADIARSGASDTTLSLRAARDIRINRSITSSGGKLNLVLMADWDSAGAGGIAIDGSGTPLTINTNGGHLWVGGNSGGPVFGTTTWNGLTVGQGAARGADATSVTEGIRVRRTTINTAGGHLHLEGHSTRYQSGEARYAVQIDTSSSIDTGAGDITILGRLYPRAGALASYPNIYGVNIDSSALRTSSGNITIDGREVEAQTSAHQRNAGISMLNSTLETTATAGSGGNITLTGVTGNQNGAEDYRDGIRLTAAGANAVMQIRTHHGNIDISGVSNATNAATSAGIRLLTNKPVNDDTNHAEIRIVSRTGNVRLIGDNPNNSNTGSAGVLIDGLNYGRIRIGADGSNSYSGNTTISARSFVTSNVHTGYLMLEGSGGLNIQPIGNDFLRGGATPGALSLDPSLRLGDTHAYLTFGRDTGAAGRVDTINVGRDLVAAGPIALHANEISIDAQVRTTQPGAGITLRGSGHMIVRTGRSLQTDGGAITLWADTDASHDGYIRFLNDVTLDARTATDRAANRTSTAAGGGAITLGGGTDLATGYATANNVTNVGGITLGDQTVPGEIRNQTRILSGGGAIALRGQRTSNDMMGISWYDGGEINAGTGTVTLTGIGLDQSHGVEIGAWQRAGSTAIIRAGGGSNTAPAIRISGQSAGRSGVQFAAGHLLEATGAGGIAVTGRSSGTGNGVQGIGAVLSANGMIHIDGGSQYTSLAGNAFLGARPGSNVPTSSAAVRLTGDNLGFGAGSTVATTGTLTIEPAGASFLNPLTWPIAALTTTGIGGLTLGKPGNSADLTIAGATAIAGPINLYGGNIAINAPLSAASSIITLQATGAISSTAALTADQLRVLGGNAVLTNVANDVGTLAASGVGNLTFRDRNALTVGSVGATVGIAASGLVDIGTLAGDLTVASNIVTSNASGNALVLNAGQAAAAGTATGGDLRISGNPLITVGDGGTARLFSGSVDNTELAALIGLGSGRFRYDSDESTTRYTLALLPGLNAIYRARPTVTRSIDDQAMVYGDAPPAWTFRASGAVNGDTFAQAFATAPTVAIGGQRSSADQPVAGDHVLGGSGGATASQLGYAVSGAIATGTLTVARRPLTVGFSAGSRDYDGSTGTTVTAVSDNRIDGDQFSIASAGQFGDPNAGIGKVVTITGVSLTGVDAANYTAATTGGANATITPRPVSISGLVAADKVYDGTTAVTLLDSGTVVTGVGQETLVLLPGASAFDDPNAGPAKAVTVTGYTLANGAQGGLASNYRLTATTATTTATIDRAVLTVIANDDAKFVTTADRDGFNGVSYTGFVHGETEAVLSGAATVVRGNAERDEAGTYPGALTPVIAGLGAANYRFQTVSGAFTIVPSDALLIRTLPLTSGYGQAASYGIDSVQYWDSGTSAPVSLTSIASLGGNRYRIADGAGGSATVTLVPTAATLSGAGLLRVGSYALAAADIQTENAGNFSNTVTVVGAHTVTARALTANPLAGIRKVYDGTTAMQGLAIGLDGVAAGDQLTVAGEGAFASRQAGSNVGYTLSHLTLAGSDAGNYFLNGDGSFVGNNGVISPRPLQLVFSASDKVYDGNRQATVTAADNRIAGDALTVTARGTFGEKNVGEHKPVAVSDIVLGGSDAGNYAVAAVADGTRASITRLDSVTWTGGPEGNWFDPANWAGGAVPDLANVAIVVIPAAVQVSFDPATAVAPAEAGPVRIDSLGAGGSLTQVGGTLAVGAGGIELAALHQQGGSLESAGNVDLNHFTQSGGTLATQGDLTVQGQFEQGAAGSVTVAGNSTIVDTDGGTTIGNLATGGALTVHSNGGPISQAPGTAISVGGSATLIAGPHDIRLDGPGNDLGNPVSAQGHDIVLVDGHGDLILGDIRASGDLEARSLAGVIRQQGGTSAEVGGRTTLTMAEPHTRSGLPDVLLPAVSPFALPRPEQAPPALLAATATAGAGLAQASLIGPGAGVVVRLLGKDPDSDGDLMVVTVPDDMVAAGFGFTLPAAVLAGETGRKALAATREDGRPLPGWLRFDSERRQFTGVTASLADLPLSLRVRAGARTVRIELSSARHR